MMKCNRCGKTGLFRKIDRTTGLCDSCTREIQASSKKDSTQSQSSVFIDNPVFESINSVTTDRSVRSQDNVYREGQTLDSLFNTFDSFVRNNDEVSQERSNVDLTEHKRRDVLQGNLFIAEEVTEEIQKSSSVSSLKKGYSQTIEDLKIEPEIYEMPEDGPYSNQPLVYERKSFPRLKRVKIDEINEPVPPYQYPPIDLLKQGDIENTRAYAQQDMHKAKLLENTLQSFGIAAKLTGIAHGPVVTRFEIQTAPGTKLSQINSIKDDIALNMAARSIHIAPVPGKAVVGIEIPNDTVETVRLRDVLESVEARKHSSRIAVGLGKDSSGRAIVADIAEMPHVLIAGQTGSGKSVCVNSIIASILFRASPEEVKLILIDPKVVELSVYNNIPHLVCPVVIDPKKAGSVLDWAVAEMVKRNKLFAEQGARDIKSYNMTLNKNERMLPKIVIIIDEIIDLMLVNPVEIEESLCRIAEQGRLCGIHLIIATQNPSANVITGNIKNNIPSRIAFAVTSQIDSRKIIDRAGAENLIGNGDMLFILNTMQPMRIQGCFVSVDEIHAIVEYIKQTREANYDPDLLEHIENSGKQYSEIDELELEYDPKLPEAVDIAIDLGQVSISMLQRRMRIGYARAGRLIDEMARRGIVAEADGAKPREVLISRDQAWRLFEE